MITRRAFLASILAAGSAPALVRAASIMPMVRRTPTGLCYVVFDSLDLTPFGNRVPEFSFEIDGGGVETFGRARVAPDFVLYGGIIERRDVTDEVHGDGVIRTVTYSYRTEQLVLDRIDGEIVRAWADGQEINPALARRAKRLPV